MQRNTFLLIFVLILLIVAVFLLILDINKLNYLTNMQPQCVLDPAKYLTNISGGKCTALCLQS